MRRERGVIDIAIVAAIAAITLVAVVLTPLGGLFGVNRNAAGKKTISREVTTVEPALDAKGKPVYVRDAQGNVSPLMRSVTSSLDESSIPKPTLWQRIKSLGFFGILAYLLTGFFLGFHFINRKIIGGLRVAKDAIESRAQNEKTALVKEAHRIVQSVDAGFDAFKKEIDKAKAVALNTTGDQAAKDSKQAIVTALEATLKAVKDAMSVEQDKSTVDFVKSLKNTGPTSTVTTPALAPVAAVNLVATPPPVA